MKDEAIFVRSAAVRTCLGIMRADSELMLPCCWSWEEE